MLQYDKDVVLSSRIRLARNIKDIPFPTIMTEEQGRKVIDLVRKAILGSNTILSTQFVEYDMKKLTPIDRQSLVEKHLISLTFHRIQRVVMLL